MKKFLTILIMIVLFTPSLSTGAVDNTIEFPTSKLYIDGSYDTKFLNYGIARPDTSQLNGWNYDETNVLFSLDVGFSYIPSNGKELGIRFVEKTSDGWKIHFSVVLNAPTLMPNVIDVDNSVKLSKSDTDVPVDPDLQVSFESDMGMLRLAGSESKLFKNESKFEETDWTYTTDFALASYDILALDNLRSETAGTNTTVKISYGNATGAGLTVASAYNLTLLNEYIPGNTDYWWRLDKEILLDGNATDEVVLNIDVTNSIISGRYVVSYAADLSDARYETVYLGGRASSDVVSATEYKKYAIEFVPGQEYENDVSNGLLLNELTETETAALVQSVPGSGILSTALEVVNSAAGWESSTALLDAIIAELSLADSLLSSTIVIDEALFAFHFPSDTVDSASDDFSDNLDHNSDVDSAADETIDETFPEAMAGTGDGTIGDLTNGTSTTEWTMDLRNLFIGMLNEQTNQMGIDVTGAITNSLGKVSEGLFSVFSMNDVSDEVPVDYSYLIMGGMALGLVILAVLYLRKK